jgi:hypothetical protein
MKGYTKICLLFTTLGMFGIVTLGNASSCDVSQVAFDGAGAMSCGSGSIKNDKVQTNIFSNWQVNKDGAGGKNNWSNYQKSTGNNRQILVLIVLLIVGQHQELGLSLIL